MIVAPVTVVIPIRKGGSAEITLTSLARQTAAPAMTVSVVDCEERGANWARNLGFRCVTTPLVLFSDDDIDWEPTAIEDLLAALANHPEASYAYGWFQVDGCTYGKQPFDEQLLRCHNYISTMSLVRTPNFPGFDESIRRLQDWDLWLTMLEQGKRGVFCNRLIFKTAKRFGISFNNGFTYHEAEAVIRAKHHL